MNDEYDELLHGSKRYEEFLVINWCFHTICNFKCSYCPPALHNGYFTGPDLEVVLNSCDKIINESLKKKYFVEFTGGEVTYYRQFTELFVKLKARGIDTGILSNGSRDISWWEQHRHLIDHICLSFHAEQGKEDHFYKITAYLNETVTTHVNIMMLPSKFDELYNFAKRLASEIDGISICLQPLLEVMRGKMFAYTNEQLAILDQPNLPWKKNIQHRPLSDKVTKIYRGEMIKRASSTNTTAITNSAELIVRNEHSWQNWNCWIGVENVVIDERGEVFRGRCRQGGSLGNINSSFALPTSPILCKALKCFCGLDIMATKKKSI